MRSITLLTISFAIAVGGTACVQVRPLKPEFTMQLQQSGGNGSYVASGTTNLPGEIKVTVQAIRQLRPTEKSNQTSPLYAILSRQTVVTNKEGKWDAKLQLLQPSTQAGGLESWQQNRQFDRSMQLEPQSQVTFIATTEAIRGDLRLEGDIEGGSAGLRSEVLQTSTDGNRFLKVQNNLTIAPPAPLAGTSPNSGRQVVKAITKPAVTNGDANQQEKTDAPLSPKMMAR
jgi:hypothetical protein